MSSARVWTDKRCTIKATVRFADRRLAVLWWAALWLLLAAAPADLLAAFPKAHGYVNDFAGILDGRAVTILESELRAAEAQTSAEIVLVTLPSLDGMTIEGYANDLFSQWRIGKHGKDNGVLILVAPNERHVRIEVGYGLEPVLPDGLAGEIIRRAFLPAFRSGDFSNGTLAGVRRVVEVVRTDHTLTPDERRGVNGHNSVQPPWLFIVFFFGLFIAIGTFALGFAIGARTVFLVLWGAGFSGASSLMLLLVPMPTSALWTLRILGLGAFVCGFAIGRSRPVRGALQSSSRSSEGSSGWTTGLSSASSDTGSSSSSSGGDFGGGASGGGGATGSW